MTSAARRGPVRATALALLCAIAVAGCGAASASTPISPGAVLGHGLQGLILKPRKPAPPLALHNYAGHVPVSLAQFAGKAVLVTFVYTHCPDVCPLIVSNLAAAVHSMGAREASRVKILAVTVDPRRDTPAAIRTFLTDRDATGTMDYLLGSRGQLHRVWKAWDVAVQTAHGQTDGHSAIVYGITASGRMAVVYSSSFSPAQIVHDVPLLASS